MSSKLSSQQLEEFSQAFKMLDVDGDGRVTGSQLQVIMKQFQFNMSDDDIKTIIKKIDTDGNGTIELHEFLNFISSQVSEPKDQTGDLKKIFQMFDKDGNGLITKQELKEGLQKMGEKMSEKDVQQLLQEADLDGDGNISLQEFLQLMMNK